MHLYGKSEGENGQNLALEILGLPEEQRINKLKLLKVKDYLVKHKKKYFVVIESRFEKHHGYEMEIHVNLTIVKIDQDNKLNLKQLMSLLKKKGSIIKNILSVSGNQGVFVSRQSKEVKYCKLTIFTINVTGFVGLINRVSLVSDTHVNDLFK